MYGGDRRVACACGLTCSASSAEVPRTPPPRKRRAVATCWSDSETTRRPTTDSATCSRSTQDEADRLNRARHRHRRVERCAAAHNPAMGRAGRGEGGIIQRTRSSPTLHTQTGGGSGSGGLAGGGLSEGLHGAHDFDM
jgi:hypothetical protein